MLHLAFYKGRGKWLDKVVRFFDPGPYSHVELTFSNLYVGPEAYCFSSSARYGGVRFSYFVLDPKKWDVVPVLASPALVNGIKTWCHSVRGKYDYTGCVGVVSPFAWQSQQRWFCSELCLTALQQAGLYTEYKPWRTSPNDLYRIVT